MEQRDSTKLALASEEAAEWFVRGQCDDESAHERRRSLQWLKQSPSHIAELLQVLKLHDVLRKMKLDIDATVDDLRLNVIELTAANSSTLTVDSGSIRPTSPSSPWKYWAMAAVAVSVTVAALFSSLQLAWLPRTYTAEAGEWRDVRLADGTMMRVGPRSKVSVRIGNKQRFIRLLHGEALFEVAKDPSRPFYVNAGLAVVRAVGTEFGVSRLEGKVVVTVAEGAVAVSQRMKSPEEGETHSKHGGGQATVAVSAGEQIAVSRSVWPTKAERVNVEHELAWAHGRLIFENRTVGEAVYEFNRRNRVQIEVRDPIIADRPVRGAFDAADPESFALFLARAAHAVVVREKQGVLLLEPTQETDTHGG